VRPRNGSDKDERGLIVRVCLNVRREAREDRKSAKRKYRTEMREGRREKKEDVLKNLHLPSAFMERRDKR
jgi:hypothetical protein